MSTQPTGTTNKAADFALGRSNCCSDSELLPEATFLNALCWERRRSDRSGNSLVLALVHLDGPKWSDRDPRLMETAARSVCAVVRGTDTAGWYRDQKCVGVIFTELRNTAKSDMNSIDAKLKEALGTALPSEVAEDVRVTYHIYPESDGGSLAVDPTLYREGLPKRKGAHIVKRCMDIMGSLVGLVALSPLMLLIALAVWLTSEGPVWCLQTRIGEGGRPFTFIKFRSMFHNSDPSLHRDYVADLIAGRNVAKSDGSKSGLYKIVNDPRVTPIGRVLRRSSLDELPQFFNVLKGDMSLVGPRPPLPYEFERYSAWHRRRVLEVKPGLTGLWQVCGRSRTNFDDMVRLDLQYAREWSLWLDLKILLMTPAAVVFGAGAY